MKAHGKPEGCILKPASTLPSLFAGHFQIALHSANVRCSVHIQSNESVRLHCTHKCVAISTCAFVHERLHCVQTNRKSADVAYCKRENDYWCAAPVSGSVGQSNGPARHAAIKQNVRRPQHRKEEVEERKNTTTTRRRKVREAKRLKNGERAWLRSSSVDNKGARKRNCHGYATKTTTKLTHRRNRKKRERKKDQFPNCLAPTKHNLQEKKKGNEMLFS